MDYRALQLRVGLTAVSSRYFYFAVCSLVLSVLLLSPDTGQARVWPIIKAGPPIVKHFRALPENEIAELARLARQVNGTKKVGQALAVRQLPNEVLEDTYLRIVLAQGRVKRREAETMHRRLQGTEGFRTTLRKVIGNNAAKSNGHLHELRLASESSAHGFKVRGINVRFKDPWKKGLTDVDVLLERRGTLIAVESKHYSQGGSLPLDTFRADMKSLSEFATQQQLQGRHVLKVFALTNRPANQRILQTLRNDANKEGVFLVFGNPGQQLHQITSRLDLL